MNDIASGAEDEDRSGAAAFELLHEQVRRWVWKHGWTGLRSIQVAAIPALIAGARDLIIASGTASGKTEAAFLPIVSNIASSECGSGFQALYISPLKALINDQFGRIDSLCTELEIPVHRWHGDASSAMKRKAIKAPAGIVLITPESLEALMIRRGREVARLFRDLRYVVIDEMHAFIDTPRGKQLQSLLHRTDIASGRSPVRVGLSATLADTDSSKRYLRPLDPDRVDVLPNRGHEQSVSLQIRGYVMPRRPMKPSVVVGSGKEDDQSDEPIDGRESVERRIQRHLFDTFRGRRGLIFAGSRGRVETTTLGLTELCEKAGVPNEFHAHHGNLSREHREEAERRMKDAARPATLVCTTTLELGIDIGSIDSVAQLGPGHTVSGMRQRLGRSGRRAGQPAIMRIYLSEMELDDGIHPLDALRLDTVQAIAMVELMRERWNEPPNPSRLHLSTMLHQILALIGQHGGVTAADCFERLVGSGVFGNVDKATFLALLRQMGSPEVGLIEQVPDGTLLPGPQGERILEGREAFSVFGSPEEYKVVTGDGHAVGTIPGDNPVTPKQTIILAGRRWRILAVEADRREIIVGPARGGHPPKFAGDFVPPSDRVVARMKGVLNDFSIPAYLDRTAADLLSEGRESFDRFGLRRKSMMRHNGRILLFPWVGDRKLHAMIFALTARGITATAMGIAIEVADLSEADLLVCLRDLATTAAPSGLSLTASAEPMIVDKFDEYLGPDLLRLAMASDQIDAVSVPEIAGTLVSTKP